VETAALGIVESRDWRFVDPYATDGNSQIRFSPHPATALASFGREENRACDDAAIINLRDPAMISHRREVRLHVYLDRRAVHGEGLVSVNNKLSPERLASDGMYPASHSD